MVEHVFPAVAVRQWVVVFPKRVRYFLGRDADCLKRVAGIAMREVQRATAGASTSPAAAGRSGGVLFGHRFGATLNAHVHLHLCMLDGVVAQGRQGLVFRRAEVDEACVERVQPAAPRGVDTQRDICGRSCWRASTGCLRSSAAGAAGGCA